MDKFNDLENTWFEKCFGFKETGSYIKNGIEIKSNNTDDIILMNTKDKKTFSVGSFHTFNYEELESKIQKVPKNSKLTYTILLNTNVYDLHLLAENRNAVFQAASQTNCLEMKYPHISPEKGITIYYTDKTQGPACALACPGGTYYRNYFEQGLFASNNQVNLFADADKEIQQWTKDMLSVGSEKAYKNQSDSFFNTRNGYAFVTEEKIELLNGTFKLDKNDTKKTKLFKKFKVGVQFNVPVVYLKSIYEEPLHRVTQVYCSALPIGYQSNYGFVPAFKEKENWDILEQLILDNIYDLTFKSAIYNLKLNQSSKRQKLFLTQVGGGAFKNNDEFIQNAIEKALKAHKHYPLDVIMVYFEDNMKYQEFDNKQMALYQNFYAAYLKTGNFSFFLN